MESKDAKQKMSISSKRPDKCKANYQIPNSVAFCRVVFVFEIRRNLGRRALLSPIHNPLHNNDSSCHPFLMCGTYCDQHSGTSVAGMAVLMRQLM